jgi:hypothetical protein
MQAKMNSRRLDPLPEGTRWPSGECVELAVLPLAEDELSTRIGLPLARGVEDGLGAWASVGGRLPSGSDVEFVCYAAMRGKVILRADKGSRYSATLDEALQLVGLSRGEVHVSPLAA